MNLDEMKVNELKEVLDAHNAPTDGNKAELLARAKELVYIADDENEENDEGLNADGFAPGQLLTFEQVRVLNSQ